MNPQSKNLVAEKLHPDEQLAAHEFDLLTRLASDKCAPLPIARTGASLRIGMPAGVLLRDLLKGELATYTETFAVAIALCEALAKVHARGIVFRNISSQNVLVATEGNIQVTWINFERATRLSRLKQHAAQPAQLKGELAYYSPELTGRINRVVDWRSDLYGLGVLLYELFTGRLPFSAETPMEWVNAHLSQHPAPVGSELPPNLAKIILTLLNKNPEARYASIQGLVFDLERLAKGERGFALRERDFSQTFALPDRLYGRDQELATLEGFIETIHDPLKFVAVAAPSGMGKTALVEELKRSMSFKGALLCSGKFDQFAQNQPFSALGQAIDELARQVMTWETSAYEAWRKKVLKSLDGYGRLLTDISPRFERILGEQPKLPDVDVELAAKRVAKTFFGFFSQCASQESPVIFFIDDLQWLDTSTLAVLEMLVARQSELRNILMIHAYRSDELKADHPYVDWMKTVDIATIVLKPLAESAVSELLSDGFGGRISDVDLGTITHLLAGRSAGSPFFLRELIGTLIDQEAIQLDSAAARWSFDQKAASKIEFSGDLAELLLTKLQQAPQETQRALALMSFVGRGFTLRQLQQCAQLESTQAAARCLWPAIELDLIAPMDEGFQMLLTSLDQGSSIDIGCRFVHDKVQAAARAQIPDEDLIDVKRDIGLRLLAGRDPIKLDREAILLADLVGQATLKGQDAINRRLLQFQAGLLSRQSGQHSVALAFLEAAMNFEGAWLPAHEAHTLMIADEFADALRANADIGRIEELWHEIDSRIEDKLDGFRVINALISAYGANGDHKKSIELYLHYVAAINSGLSPKATSLDVLLAYKKAKKAIGDPKVCFANLKVADRKMAALQHLMLPAGSAFIHGGESLLLARIICDVARFGATKGVIPHHYAGVTVITTVAQSVGDYAFARDLAYAPPPPETYAAQYPVLAMYAAIIRLSFVDHAWKVATRETLMQHAWGVEINYRQGDIQGAVEYAIGVISSPLARGQSFLFLNEVARFQKKIGEDFGFSTVPYFLDAIEFLRLVNEVATEKSAARLLASADSKYPIVGAVLTMMQVVFPVVLGEPLSYDMLHKWRHCEEDLMMFLLRDTACCYIEIGAMRFGSPRIPSFKERIEETAKRKLFQARIKKLRGIGSDILDALVTLVLGCRAEMRGKTKKALGLYQEAYEAANRAQGARDKLMAAEYSFRLLRRTNREAALVWLQRTLAAADEYAFMPKTVALQEEFAEDIRELHALFPQLRSHSSNFDHKASDDLDLATLIQAGADLAEAKDLSALVAKALEIVVKNLSATRAQLWQHADGAWTSLGGDGEFSAAFLDEIYRSKEIRVIDNAADTEYELKCQSALCLPMASGGQSIGLMVIENDTLTEAFPRSRLPFLKTLGNQIATAIANALLYAQMEEKVQEKARAMVAIMTHIEQGILTIEASGKIADDYSSALPQILGLTQIAGRDAMEILFGQAELATDVVDQVGATLFASLGEDVLNFEVNAERLISEFSLRSGKIIEVDWVPIVDDFDEVRSIMVTLRDVTQVRASQAAAEASAMELKRIGCLLALSPRQVSDFFDDARARLEASKARVEQSADPSDWLELNFRDLHTLKGVSRSYQFLDLAAMIHEVEEPYQTARQSAESALPDTAALSVALAELLDLISDYERIEHEVLKRQGASSLDLAGLRAAAASRDWQAVDNLLAEEQTLDLEGLLAPVIRSLPTLAKDLGRPEPQLIFDLQSTTIDPSWGTTLLGALTHVLRNSVDHGLKTAKSGEIHLGVAETPDQVRITIEDAGRGLNLAALEKKLGISSDEDLAEAIFRSGLSTNENVSDISGRGVGMDAVRAALEERGGRVMVEFVGGARDAEGYRKHRLVMVLPKVNTNEAVA